MKFYITIISYNDKKVGIDAGEEDGDAEGDEEEAAEEAPAEGEGEEGEGKENKNEMTPRTLARRVDALTESITYEGFNFTRRGTLEMLLRTSARYG